jgi:hypothetical protein
MLAFVALVLTAAFAHASWFVLIKLVGELTAWRFPSAGVG